MNWPTIYLGFLVLFLNGLAPVFADSLAPRMAQNFYAAGNPVPGTEKYLTSGLSEDELFEILGLPPGIRILRDFKDNPLGQKRLDRWSMIANIAKYMVQIKTFDEGPWKTLAEKRYSFLRDLLTALIHASENGWSAVDYKINDGTYVFTGGQHSIVIRGSDGALVRGRFDNTFNSNAKFETLDWIEAKRWDGPDDKPCHLEISQLAAH